MAVAGFATPAAAGSNLCGADLNCIYTDSNYVGLLGNKGGNQGNSNLSSGADNKMDSWENKTGYNSAWYDDPDGRGSCNNMLSRTEKSFVGFTARNGMSSWKTNGAC